jgi:methionyl aminopeptidase
MTIAETIAPVHGSVDIEFLTAAGQLVAQTLDLVEEHIAPGVTTRELDLIAEDFIRSHGGRPAFKGYKVDHKEFPATLCVSIDEEVVHGIPGQRALKKGQIVSVDCGVELQGFFGDSARTFAVGEVSADKQRLMDVTREALMLGVEAAVEGARVHDISKAVQTHVAKHGFSVVRDLVGHGIGRNLHEEPPVPNFVPGLLHRNRYPNVRLQNGMALAIEPMVNMGLFQVHTASDGWTVYTADNKPSAHFEHTVVVNGNSPIILTLSGKGL